jgi:D-alanyl-lipoteichoic acid acyltransferase DltB (MBOAT superfamily)
MLFNSIEFLLFLPVVFFLYWFVLQKKLNSQNILLLVSSYFFYACWDYRFLFLLLFSTFLDYYTGIKMEESSNNRIRKIWLIISVGINLGFLGVFKYYDFFATSFAEALSGLGLQVNPATLNIILPVGISFYTFHGLSYVLDIYFNRIKAERNFVEYGVFVSFFPLLVAGPIERATHLLPQIKKPRTFRYQQAVQGVRQILWGLFKKVVIADNCAMFVDAVFPDYAHASNMQLILAICLFAFQIYGDFSGYSDMATGVAKLFGIELLRNFNYPYFSRSIAEFWRRWHISLSSWFRDYLYIPLGGSRVSKGKQVRNTFIIFLVSGFWHGANWTFIFWGLLHAIYILPSIIFSTNRQHLAIVAQGSRFPSIKEFMQMAITFVLSSFAWIFFRATSLQEAFGIIGAIGHGHGRIEQLSATYPIAAVAIMLYMEWRNRETNIPFSHLKNKWLRYSTYLLILFLIFMMGAFINPRSFIYFQF